jgi:hypothetical protein
MDPYLEDPEFWPDVHHRLISVLADELGPRLRPKYFVAVEIAVVVVPPSEDEGRPIPDVVIGQEDSTGGQIGEAVATYGAVRPMRVKVPIPETVRLGVLKVRSVKGKELVTVIEVLSPFNKAAGKGRDRYERKRERILRGPAGFVEIDLLRRGRPMPMSPDGHDADYRILISPSDTRPSATLYAFDVTQAIPVIPVPLLPEDEPVLVDLCALFHDGYERACYDLRINYRAEPDPPLGGEAAAWADRLLQAANLRPAAA